jgi:hypothetical protein
MIENSFIVTEQNFKDGLSGNALLLNNDELKETYKYIGIWYARDGNDKTSVTTEIYFSDDTDQIRPADFQIEIKENSFKQFSRMVLPLEKKRIWIAARIDDSNYCRMKTGDVKQGKVYVNYKIVHNKGNMFDIVGSGNLKGGTGDYFGVYCEDNTGREDFNDLVMFFVALKQLPPDDWKMDHYCLGIDGLPVLTQVFKFADNRKYSGWLGQTPLK